MTRSSSTRRLVALERRHFPEIAAPLTIAGMDSAEFLSRLCAAEREHLKCALESLLVDETDTESFNILKETISLALDRKAARLICLSERKPPQDYLAEIHEAQAIYGSEAWRYVAERREFFEVEPNGVIL
jgi:hypothetical protein